MLRQSCRDVPLLEGNPLWENEISPVAKRNPGDPWNFEPEPEYYDDQSGKIVEQCTRLPGGRSFCSCLGDVLGEYIQSGRRTQASNWRGGRWGRNVFTVET